MPGPQALKTRIQLIPFAIEKLHRRDKFPRERRGTVDDKKRIPLLALQRACDILASRDGTERHIATGKRNGLNQPGYPVEDDFDILQVECRILRVYWVPIVRRTVVLLHLPGEAGLWN